jgi:16S rRNA (uracil1498-N3)-methyltransferase
MIRSHFSSTRLFVPEPLAAGTELLIGAEASNYLRNSLRLEPGAEILVFNGRHGEWRARLTANSRKETRLEVLSLSRPQTLASSLHYAFAPIKHARLDFMVQKAVEMGVARISPVITRHTQVARVNVERMRANVIEAAQQCGILAIPNIDQPLAFAKWLAGIAADRTLVFCDEEAETGDPLNALTTGSSGPLTLVVGPEGGFDAEERRALLDRKAVIRLSLGPRILRADTAAIAALAIVQAVRGDWR